MINESYLDAEVQQEMMRSWKTQQPPRLLLQGFLMDEAYAVLREELLLSRGERVRVADRYSYTRLPTTPTVAQVFLSSAFREFLGRMLGKKVKQVKIEVRSYGWKDYTLLHDAEEGEAGIRFFFFVLPPTIEAWDYFWGGNKIFSTERGKGKPLVFTPFGNSLGVIHQGKDVLGFTQYLNHYVGDERVMVVEGMIH